MARAWQLFRVAARHRLDTLVPYNQLKALGVPLWQRVLLRANPMRLWPKREGSPGERLVEALTELGPIYIKLGQLLSTRPDVVPFDIAQALSKLQDQVPPIDSAVAVSLIETALEAPLGKHFATFDRTPLAAASIAQVHTATLHDGSQVVVKVVRPGLEAQIDADMVFFRSLAGRLERRFATVRRLRLQAVLDDYERTIRAELDMHAEAANTTRLRTNFAGSELLYVPRVHPSLCRSNVLVLERIYGVQVSEVDKMQAAGVDLALLAERGVRTFFTQVFEDNFFHADMHPGNVYVDISDPANPSYIALDCAIMGTLTEQDQNYLARNLLAFFNQDYGEVARLHVRSGWVPADTDVAEFERVIRSVCEPIFDKPLGEIAFGEMLVELFQTAERFDMQVQPQLVLLQKTLLYIEGLGRKLYPQLDLMTTARPFMMAWLNARMGPAAQLRRMAERAPEFLQTLPELPQDLAELRAQQSRQAAQIETLSAALERSQRSSGRARAAGFALVVLGGVLALGQGSSELFGPAALMSALTGSAILWRFG